MLLFLLHLSNQSWTKHWILGLEEYHKLVQDIQKFDDCEKARQTGYYKRSDQPSKLPRIATLDRHIVVADLDDVVGMGLKDLVDQRFDKGTAVIKSKEEARRESDFRNLVDVYDTDNDYSLLSNILLKRYVLKDKVHYLIE